jgi:N-methylhydantoinase A/oxoprolinase/acetone carboxylase beta subunit
MGLTLGIDTGGTYTDAVLIDSKHGDVIAAAKALTTYHDLTVGIGGAVDAALAGGSASGADATLVALSTTLATNAIVEGRGMPVCLLLIGYDRGLLAAFDLERELVAEHVVYLDGGHDGEGREAAPLDEDAAREAIRAYQDRVSGFAVSGYFSVRNPDHELRVKALVEAMTGLPVTCGHELTSRLDAVRRATTAALNARLIPLLQELMTTVRRALDARGIAAPLMVVRGDGSLVRAGWAMERPVETILSGPAASILGAHHLAGGRDGWVVDIGGTTTDIAALHEGRPLLNPDGARVGGWRTRVRAVDIHTVGLGGDSLVTFDGRTLSVGPRRVVPLCALAAEHPAVLDALRDPPDTSVSLAGQFAYLLAPPTARQMAGLDDLDAAIVSLLGGGPRPVARLADELRYRTLLERRLAALAARRLVMLAGFTPTDALHALGRFTRWDTEAASLGAAWLAGARLPAETLCARVAGAVSSRIGSELVTKALSDEGLSPDWDGEPTARALLSRALEPPGRSGVGCALTLHRPIIAIGAPAGAYVPAAADKLSADLAIPSHAGVANAVGAAVGTIFQQMRAEVRPVNGGESFRVHLPGGVVDVSTVEEGVRHARNVVTPQLEALAHEAGAEQVEITMTRRDHQAALNPTWGDTIYLSTELTFTAAGRPSPARAL